MTEPPVDVGKVKELLDRAAEPLIPPNRIGQIGDFTGIPIVLNPNLEVDEIFLMHPCSPIDTGMLVIGVGKKRRWYRKLYLKAKKFFRRLRMKQQERKP